MTVILLTIAVLMVVCIALWLACPAPDPAAARRALLDRVLVNDEAPAETGVTDDRRADSMMDAFDRGALLFVKVFAVVLTGVALGYAWRMAQMPPPEEQPKPRQFTAEERRYITERLKFHGIPGAIIENGEAYFIRNGKKCRL